MLGGLSTSVDPSFFIADKFEILPRRDSNSRTKTSSIRGLPLDHRGDRLVVAVVVVVFTLKPFLLPNDISSTPSVLPDSSS